MRLDLAQHVASSCLAAFRMLQDIVAPQDLHPATAQTAGKAAPNVAGCVDSPEAATMILLLVGMIGIYFGSQLYTRRMQRKQLSGSL